MMTMRQVREGRVRLGLVLFIQAGLVVIMGITLAVEADPRWWTMVFPMGGTLIAYVLIRLHLRRQARKYIDGRIATTERGFPVWLDACAAGIHVGVYSSSNAAHDRVWIEIMGGGGRAQVELDSVYAGRISDALANYVESTRKDMP